ncbi:unnamed protein product [Paramecium octaurelia]|uniref:Uncharacterized protein n=1 Tax=Paramecium octaurelia TaxID=43137 RepID=A0A8S1T060_PAROT|nr:unnamed protein product [Paramecium octaurelia]
MRKEPSINSTSKSQLRQSNNQCTYFNKPIYNYPT